MSRPILEVIALDAEDACAAQAGGADRLELVSAIEEDGLTPSRETVARVVAAIDIPVRVMLRPANGFQLAGQRELESLCAEARFLRGEGASEFVFGYLDEAGLPDIPVLAALNEAVAGCRWTYHRAIDRAADRDGLRKRLASLGDLPGLDTYLTAGSADGVGSGLDVLRSEARRSRTGEPGYGPRLMVGGGLQLRHVPELLAEGVDAFHIGGAARNGGWAGRVAPGEVGAWREVLGG